VGYERLEISTNVFGDEMAKKALLSLSFDVVAVGIIPRSPAKHKKMRPQKNNLVGV